MDIGLSWRCSDMAMWMSSPEGDLEKGLSIYWWNDPLAIILWTTSTISVFSTTYSAHYKGVIILPTSVAPYSGCRDETRDPRVIGEIIT